MSWVSRLAAKCGLRRATLDDEIGQHLDVLAREHEARGMTPEAARLAARRDFGGTLRVHEAVLDQTWRRWLERVAVDGRSGLRYLRKYPGLNIASAFALALAIGLGTAWYDLSGELFHPTLPLPGGTSIVEIRTTNELTSTAEGRVLHDLRGWQRDARTVQDVGAARTARRNLLVDGMGMPAEPVTVAVITPSAFQLVRTPPLLGRPLLDADAVPGAASVVVLGYDAWQRLFAGRADVVGRTVHLGAESVTVVGVMPEGFGFPRNHHLWMPLEEPPSGYAALEGPAVMIFGRLAPGLSLAAANAEFTLLGQREATASPATHEHLRPRVVAFASLGSDLLRGVATHLPILLVLVVACANVATLIYARTATREAEIATRHAVGASRGHIIGQFFSEALVLALIASVAGLLGAHFAMKGVLSAIFPVDDGRPPFWISSGLRLTTVPYAVGLAVVCAVIFGVLPAVKATGALASRTLTQLGPVGSGLRFGTVWTAAMVVQVATTVMCLWPAMGVAREAVRDRAVRGLFPTEAYLAVQLAPDRDGVRTAETPSAFVARTTRVYEDVQRRIEQEPGVLSVTFADELPGMGVSTVQGAEVEYSPGAAPATVSTLWISAVGPGFFDTFDRPFIVGRDFHDGDRATDARTVIVNEAFARRVMNGASPVGVRLRYTTPEDTSLGPWFEIVGVVKDIGMTPTRRGEAPYVYHAAALGALPRVTMGVRMAGGMNTLMSRVASIVASADPTVRVEEVRSLDEMARREVMPQTVIAWTLAIVVGLGLILAASGVFALTSLDVSRRTREIGLRTALGASRYGVLASMFWRIALLLGSGVAVGNMMLLPFLALDPETSRVDLVQALLVTSSGMLLVGVLACAVPAHRALRMAPAEALRAV